MIVRSANTSKSDSVDSRNSSGFQKITIDSRISLKTVIISPQIVYQ